MDAHKHKTALVKLLEHGLELRDGGHILVVTGVGIVVVKGTVGIDDQRMEKDMRHLIQWIGRTGLSCRLIPRGRILHFLASCI